MTLGFISEGDDDQGCRKRPSLSLHLVYLHMSQENYSVSMIYVDKPFSSDDVYMSDAVVVFLMGSEYCDGYRRPACDDQGKC